MLCLYYTWVTNVYNCIHTCVVDHLVYMRANVVLNSIKGLHCSAFINNTVYYMHMHVGSTSTPPCALVDTGNFLQFKQWHSIGNVSIHVHTHITVMWWFLELHAVVICGLYLWKKMVNHTHTINLTGCVYGLIPRPHLLLKCWVWPGDEATGWCWHCRSTKHSSVHKHPL